MRDLVESIKKMYQTNESTRDERIRVKLTGTGYVNFAKEDGKDPATEVARMLKDGEFEADYTWDVDTAKVVSGDQVDESPMNETAEMTAEELEGLMDDVQGVMDELSDEEQEQANALIGQITDAMGEDDFVTASDYAEELIELIGVEDDADIASLGEASDVNQEDYDHELSSVKERLHSVKNALTFHEKTFMGGHYEASEMIGELRQVEELLAKALILLGTDYREEGDQ